MRRRIAWLVVATTSSVVASFVIPLCLLVQTLAEDRAMSAADQEARNVALLVAGVERDRELADLLAGLDNGEGPETSVLTARGRELGAGTPMADDPDVLRALDGEAFRVISNGEGRVLLPVLVPAGTAVVRSTVDEDLMREGVAAAWIGIGALGAVLLMLAVGVARQLGRRISEPLLGVADTAHRLREGDLGARAEVVGTEETQELARALNGLAERTTELLAHERAAVGDLSHRLRTPVTALRLDAESVNDPALADRLRQHIGVLQRTVDAIVQEARRPVRTDLSARSDIVAVVAERVEFWRVLAEDQGRPVSVTIAAGPLAVAMATSDLRDLVDILVDNIFAHTPEGTGWAVDLAQETTRTVRLTVSDDGPGVLGAAATAPRRPGTSGLGLDIASRTVESVGGTVTLARGRVKGTVVTIDLPLVRND